MTKLHIETTINGEAAEFLCDPPESLLAALRDRLGLTGTKEGCATGDCGACSVLLDGRLVAVVPGARCRSAGAVGHDDRGCRRVATRLHPVQQKFLEHAALQCGICTPGFIVAATALLERNPAPSEQQVRYWLAGNLCRCTGYDKIVRAVLDAAPVMKAMRSNHL